MSQQQQQVAYLVLAVVAGFLLAAGLFLWRVIG